MLGFGEKVVDFRVGGFRDQFLITIRTGAVEITKELPVPMPRLPLPIKAHVRLAKALGVYQIAIEVAEARLQEVVCLLGDLQEWMIRVGQVEFTAI